MKKYFKLIFCNLILIAFLSQMFVNGILSNVAYAESINFPKATKYTSQQEITTIWQESQNYYTETDGNPNNNPNFNQDAMIGVQGWHMGIEFSVSKFLPFILNIIAIEIIEIAKVAEIRYSVAILSYQLR